jgi:hypothetical protein
MAPRRTDLAEDERHGKCSWIDICFVVFLDRKLCSDEHDVPEDFDGQAPCLRKRVSMVLESGDTLDKAVQEDFVVCNFSVHEDLVLGV